jgi:hypothetical protein
VIAIKLRHGRNRGSITVEASIIVPLVILSIVALIYIGIVLYQRAQLRSAADMAAETGATVWSDLKADTGTGRVEMSDVGRGSLYWRLVDTGRDEKLKRITVFTENALRKGRLLNAATTKVRADIKDYIVYKKLEVVVENTYELPLGSLLRLFGASGCFSIKVKSESVIDEPVELIRNVDFAIDLEKELEDRFPELKNLREKTRDTLTGVKGKINEFLD